MRQKIIEDNVLANLCLYLGTNICVAIYILSVYLPVGCRSYVMPKVAFPIFPLAEKKMNTKYMAQNASITLSSFERERETLVSLQFEYK